MLKVPLIVHIECEASFMQASDAYLLVNGKREGRAAPCRPFLIKLLK